MEAHTRDGVSAGVPKGPLRLRPSACTHLGFQPSLNTRVCALAGVRISRPWGGGWLGCVGPEGEEAGAARDPCWDSDLAGEGGPGG